MLPTWLWRAKSALRIAQSGTGALHLQFCKQMLCPQGNFQLGLPEVKVSKINAVKCKQVAT